MTDLRQAAQQALDAWDSPMGMKDLCVAMDTFRAALKQQAEPPEWLLIKAILDEYGLQAIDFVAEWKAAQQQAEPVSHAVIVGALFDFMGWLTTRKKRLILSSTDNASPAADAIKDFAEMRGLLLDDALVQDWQNYTTPPQRKPLTVDQVWQNDQLMSLNAELGCSIDLLMEVVEAVEAAQGVKD